MPIPELQRLRVGAILSTYCERKAPLAMRKKLRLDYRFDGNLVTLFESRPGGGKKPRWRKRPVARFRYMVGKKLWVLYVPEGRGEWAKYGDLRPSADFKTILAEVDHDPRQVFWPR